MRTTIPCPIMRKVFATIIVIVCSVSMQAWDWWPLPMAKPDTCRDSILYEVSIAATAGSGKYNAFWMQSGEQGSVSASPYSGSLHTLVCKPATRANRWFDYEAAVDLIGMVHSRQPYSDALIPKGPFPVYQGNYGSFIVRQFYAHVRLYIVDIAAGVMPVTDGMDTPLGSGSLMLSHNAPSMPALRIGFDRWTPIPGLFGYAELKGGIVHAWLTDNIGVSHSKLHYKWIGMQLGGCLPVNVSYELHHAAQWGGYDAEGNDLGNNLSTFKRVFLAQAGSGSYNESHNAAGNHTGSQQIAVTLKGAQWNVKCYWQNFLEDNFNFIGMGHNLPDGRWGVSANQSQWPFIHTLTIEYVCTTDQSGPMHDQDGIIYAGNDTYYYNYIYQQGWNYYLRSLGTPLITSPIYNLDSYTQTRNSRIQAWHAGVGGDIYGYQYLLMGTYTRNYGDYVHNDWYDMQSENTALMLDVSKRVEKAWGLEFGVRLAADFGTQWGNQVSGMIRISKKGILTSYR